MAPEAISNEFQDEILEIEKLSLNPPAESREIFNQGLVKRMEDVIGLIVKIHQKSK